MFGADLALVHMKTCALRGVESPYPVVVDCGMWNRHVLRVKQHTMIGSLPRAQNLAHKCARMCFTKQASGCCHQGVNAEESLVMVDRN
eukprot:scaffold164299_cov23-Tisochrysis_lutea.AAC.2